MADQLKPMKTLLGRTMVCGFLALIPYAVFESLWSDPQGREMARGLDDTAEIWISYAIYLLVVFMLWFRWVTRSEGRGQ